MLATEVGVVETVFLSFEENRAAVMAAPLKADAPAMMARVVFDIINTTKTIENKEMGRCAINAFLGFAISQLTSACCVILD